MMSVTSSTRGSGHPAFKVEDQASLPTGKAPPAEAENDSLGVKQLSTLSAREIAILERIVRGDSNKHVARFFDIAETTVKAHQGHISKDRRD
jgi:FixJ family two-component response regulator